MKQKDNLPSRTRTYRSHLLDSARWDRFRPRGSDIVVATAYKSGTTWMQTIVGNLIFAGRQIPAPIMELSPWIDMPFRPLEGVLESIEQQQHRRFLKTHLALDGLRFLPQIKYIYVARDLRDVFMSVWNHHRNYSQQALDRLREIGEELGTPWPDCPDDVKVFWTDWITRGSFPWEADGYPYWSVLHHLDTWWRYRHLPNIVFVHYNDLLRDVEGEMRRIAGFLDIEVSGAAWPELTDAVSFETMRKNAEDVLGESQALFEGGSRTFFHKGTNQRWLGVLDDGDLELYRSAVDRTLDPRAAVWLEEGGPI